MRFYEILRFKWRICVLFYDELKGIILDKGHKSKMSLHSGMTKMYLDLKQSFLWFGIKVNVTRYSLTCQKWKIEHSKY